MWPPLWRPFLPKIGRGGPVMLVQQPHFNFQHGLALAIGNGNRLNPIAHTRAQPDKPGHPNLLDFLSSIKKKKPSNL